MQVLWTGIGVSLLTLCAACAGPQPTATEPATETDIPLRDVELGMQVPDVRSALGPPLRIIRTDGAVVWMVYGTSAERVRIHFDDNVVTAVPRRDRGGSRGRRAE